MFPAAINNVGFMYSAGQGLAAAVDLGDHAADNGTVTDELIKLIPVERAEQLTVFVTDPGHVGQQDKFFRLQGGGDGAGHQIGIDIEGLAVLTNPNRGNHRDKTLLLEGLQNSGVNRGHGADPAQVDQLGWGVLQTR